MSYDAMGTKLSKKVSVGATEQYTQHYLGGIEYNAVGTTRKLEAIYFADGRVYNTNVTTASTTVALRYEYAIRDHLGNTRLMFSDLDNLGTISSNEILQENHYYPFGMNMEGVWMNDAGSKDSKYLYNGKELNDDFGLGWMDYGARWYDAGIGRWNGVDDLADKSRSSSPYIYVENNPVLMIDPDGMENITYIHIMQGSNLSAAEQNEMLTLVNQYFNHLGLKRKAMIIQGPIKPENFDKTDNLVVMGNSPGQVLKFMKENLSEMYGGDIDNLWESWGSQSIEVSGNNPEHSENNPNGKEDVVGVTIGGAAMMADNMTKSTFKERSVSKEELLAFFAVHGTGHNAGSKHGPGPGETGFMLDGGLIYNSFKNNKNHTSVRSFFNTKIYPGMLEKDNGKPSWQGGNIGIIALMKKAIGGYKTPVDNYSVRSKK
ncbi:RHS repeat-associated core domain protein [Haliscomenobacter hydrossis DSM 1100]|uniref:RHS repeat-associated core domain protein n=2 Tax=Haliscomenobacter TaxID=2349 RepID=F4KUG4_HALH1|nr:RHS repeat-associated core domain protein [Haliscomenobacter hydrossis DSM 1100]